MKLTLRSRKAIAEVSYNLFTQADYQLMASDDVIGEVETDIEKKPKLPSVGELYLLFDQLNHKYFGGSLPRVEIKYSGRMLIAGSYTPKLRVIKMGKKYHLIFPDEIEDTLKHEMIHILYPKHDAKFKAVAAGIGASVKATYHPDLRAPHKYLYICPSCKKEYPRRKKLRMASCGKCSINNRFDPKFKLKLKKNL